METADLLRFVVRALVVDTQTNSGEAGNTWNLFSRQMAHDRYKQISAASPVDSILLT